AFAQMSDTSGTYEVVLFADVLAGARDVLDSGAPLVLTVEARRDDDTIKLAARHIEPLDGAIAPVTLLALAVTAETALAGLRSALGEAKAGRGKVHLILPRNGGDEVVVTLPGGFALTPGLISRLSDLPGVALARA
ncbi:MAG: DNA polymerase III subunit alpha, partial [Alphaproteobacteria bacterium]